MTLDDLAASEYDPEALSVVRTARLRETLAGGRILRDDDLGRLLPIYVVVIVRAGSDEVAVVFAAARAQRVALEAVAGVLLVGVVGGGVADDLLHDLCRGEACAGAGVDAEPYGAGGER
jgi:hypothetical protein